MILGYPASTARVLEYFGFVNHADFRTFAEGDGSISVEWLSVAALPTPAEIVAAELPAAKVHTISANRADCERRIFSRYPAGRQLSALAGLYDSANVATMTDWIAATIAAENTAADAIEAATTVQQVEAVTVAWPA